MAEGGVSVDSNRAGNAAFVVNIDPVPGAINKDFRSRPSGREDITNLLEIFNTLGLECINKDSKDHQNLAVNQWDHRRSGRSIDCRKNPCLCCRIKSKDHSRSKCFLLAFSSHGREITETEIMFSDGKSITLTEIFDALSDENCPTLKEIPRIILLLACRGNFKDPDRNHAMQDSGVALQIDRKEQGEKGWTESMDCSHTAGPSSTTSNVDGAGQSMTWDYTLQHSTLNKMPKNFLLVYPVVSGQLNYSNNLDGTWLVHAMLDTIREHMKTTPVPRSINFFHLLTNAARKVSEREPQVSEKGSDEKIRKNNNGERIKDKEKSGFKNAVCSHHRLVQPLILNLRDKKNIPTPTLL